MAMLYIVATPIGNIEDITLRALKIFREADFILAEDTRKTGFLLKRLGIEKPLVSFFEHNEAKRIPWVLDELRKGKNIVLVSSAGTPSICDPGYKLVRACRSQNLALTSLPGPSSLINALAISSLPHEAFSFLGYLPKKTNARKKILKLIKERGITAVFFESPFRIAASLSDIREVCGEVNVCLAREMTKKFEEVFEGTAAEALSHLAGQKVRGEFVVIIGAVLPS